jgi:hypothetical protein
MKLPALKDLSTTTSRTFIRFPFAVLCAVVGTIMALALIDLPFDNKEMQNQLTKGIMTMYLGMLAGISCTVFCEKYFFRSKTQYIFNFVILLLMHYYYYTLPDELQDKEISRFIVLALASHLALAFAPFLVDNEPNGFWQYNKQLFLRILTALFYSHVLFLGLALALIAVEKLFNLNFNDNNYGKLYIIITGVFNTLFFLAGVPDDIRTLEDNNEYPKGLKIFTQFVLLPLIGLYLIILYVYAGKIIFTHEWPQGWVAWLINGYAIAGILAFLLIWPLRRNEMHQWIKTYSRFFYATLLPLIALLFVAIGIRVRSYGMTEQRYFIVIVAIWLGIMALYFIFSKIKNIKVIPFTLFIACVLAAYGPLSAYEISERSQHTRLIALLNKNAMLKNNKAVPSKKQLSFYDKREISSTVNYLVTMHGLNSVQHLFTVNLDSLTSGKANEYLFKPGKVLELLGVEYTYGNEDSQVSQEMNFNIIQEAVISTDGYDYMIAFNISSSQLEKSSLQTFAIGNKKLNILLRNNNRIDFSVDEDAAASLDIKEVTEKLKNDYGQTSYEIPAARMMYDVKGSKYEYRCQIKTLNVTMAPDSTPKLNYLEGYILVK